MALRQSLLTQGNGKLGEAIHAFSIPALLTCPGKSPTCSKSCYALKNRFSQGFVQDRLAWCFEQTKRPDFVSRMVKEIHSRGVLVCRIHCSGDFFSPAYTRKWTDIVAACPKARFFGYTRSWKVPQIARKLRTLAALPNMAMWYSADKDIGRPARVPDRVRVAWLQTSEDDEPGKCDLVFRVRRLRKLPASDLVCPHERPDGKGVTCASCGICW